MTDRHEATAHQDILILLPFEVNGTLDDDEHARVQEHLRGCADCRRALAEERALAGAFAGMTVAVPSGAAALNRLLATLNAGAETSDGVLPFTRLAAPPATPVRRGWAPLAAAATVLLTIALGALTSLQVARQPAAPGYRALASADRMAPPLPGALNVVVVPALGQAGLEHLLQDLPVTAISPRAQPGTFQVQLDHGSASAATLAAAAAMLAGHPGVLFAAPASTLPPEARP